VLPAVEDHVWAAMEMFNQVRTWICSLNVD
jgi:hypothetical protein